MASTKGSKKSGVDKTTDLRFKPNINVEARSDSQQEVIDLWPRSRILFLIGPAGGGKTHIALALAIAELMKYSTKDRPKLMLSRPMVAVDEQIGYLPGTVEEKLLPWLGPFKDVLTQITFDKWDTLIEDLDVEVVPVGMFRGRTIRNGVLVVDEAQALSPAQLLCILTRIGENGRIVLCGDPTQSDNYSVKNSPLLAVAKKLDKLDTVATVHFKREHQLRDPLITDIINCLT